MISIMKKTMRINMTPSRKNNTFMVPIAIMDMSTNTPMKSIYMNMDLIAIMVIMLISIIIMLHILVSS